jgi:small subunit ribosomal protein S1
MKKLVNAEDYFAVGDEVEAVIIEANKEQWILKLSIRRILEKLNVQSFEQYLEDEEKMKCNHR